MRLALALMAAAALVTTAAAQAPQAAQAPMTPTQMVAAQQAAMARMAALDGVWRGEAWMIDRPGETPRQMTQTMRVGPFLDGAVKVMETRGYLADGSLGFHAFNTLAFDAEKAAYVMNARAAGRSGQFSFRPTADGYVWEIGGGGRGLRYTGVVKDGVWTEVGESLDPARAPIRMSEMTLRRVGPTDWPEAGAIPPR
jgi:hypothetical protein